MPYFFAGTFHIWKNSTQIIHVPMKSVGHVEDFGKIYQHSPTYPTFCQHVINISNQDGSLYKYNFYSAGKKTGDGKSS